MHRVRGGRAGVGRGWRTGAHATGSLGVDSFEGDVVEEDVAGGEVDVEVDAHPLDFGVGGFEGTGGDVHVDGLPGDVFLAWEDFGFVVLAASGFGVVLLSPPTVLVRLVAEAFEEEAGGGAAGEVADGEAVFFVVVDGDPGRDAGEAVVFGDVFGHAHHEAVAPPRLGIFGIAGDGFGDDGDGIFGELLRGVGGDEGDGLVFGGEDFVPVGGEVVGGGGCAFEGGVGDEVGTLGEALFDGGVGVVGFDEAKLREGDAGEIGEDFFDGGFGGFFVGGDLDRGGFGEGWAVVEAEGEGAVFYPAHDGFVDAEGGEEFLRVVVGGEGLGVVGLPGELEGGDELFDLDVVEAVEFVSAVCVVGHFLADGEAHFFGEGFVLVVGGEEGEDGQGSFVRPGIRAVRRERRPGGEVERERKHEEHKDTKDHKGGLKPQSHRDTENAQRKRLGNSIHRGPNG